MRTTNYVRMIGALAVGFGFLVAGSTFAARTDGKALFEKRCGGCHALDRDKEGPRLGGVYGRAAASVDSFQYSDALKRVTIVWSDDTLDRWLTDPEKVAPGNDMSFHVESAEERSAIIAYLKGSAGK
jgi:cytochrome c